MLKEILKAQVYDVAIETPLQRADKLSSQLTNNIFIKREDLQDVHSFKIRGAYNKIKQLTKEEQSCGIVAASAGNHAQGVAQSASVLGINATIVMPATTPNIKVDVVRSFGAKVVLIGDSFDDARIHAEKLAKEELLTYVHPFDDFQVIAGQGTIGIELYKQLNGNIDYVFIPVGGGGLLAGITSYLKVIDVNIKIIPVESVDSACLKLAMDNNQRDILPRVGIFADGVAVKQIGEKTFDLVKDIVEPVVTVDVDEICVAIKDIFNDNRSISEPAGALAIAGAKKYLVQNNIKDKNCIVIQSGSNINFDRLRHVSERAEDTEIIFAASIDEKAGSFLKFCKALGNSQISEFNYRYSDTNKAQVFVGVRIAKVDQKTQLFKNLSANNIDIVDMSDNEIAKQHVRYMVGGHQPDIVNEQLLKFEFPERPGALLDFLMQIGESWNISMFHYRNHGAAFGRVLIGIQVDEAQLSEFNDFLKRCGYEFAFEGDNPAYKLFLA